jgi:hypothetical protein
MNRSSRKAHEATASGFRRRARQLLHAFADAGQPSVSALQLLVGPNGVLVWTAAAQVDRSHPYAGEVFATPEKPVARVDGQSPAAIRPQEPAETPLYAPRQPDELAPVGN